MIFNGYNDDLFRTRLVLECFLEVDNPLFEVDDIREFWNVGGIRVPNPGGIEIEQEDKDTFFMSYYRPFFITPDTSILRETFQNHVNNQGFYLDGIAEKGDYSKIFRWSIGMLEEFSRFRQKVRIYDTTDST